MKCKFLYLFQKEDI